MSMWRVHFWSRRLHRWAAYLVGIQLAIWVGGGLVFAWVPFDSVVKSGAVLATSKDQGRPQNWSAHLTELEKRFSGISALKSQSSAQGALLEFQAEGEPHWLSVSNGAIDSQVTADQIRSFAQSLYAGEGTLSEITFIDHPDSRMAGLVDELYGRTQVWRASFADEYGTRLYFDHPQGRYLTARNDYWVVYDAMWRLHIMDYRGGEDFNNVLLTSFATMSGLFVITGLLLSFFALQRVVRSWVYRGR